MKARFIYLHPEANIGKVAALDALQEVYTVYLKTCVDQMISAHRFDVPRNERQVFFPRCEELSSQIVKNVRAHAVGIVNGWAAAKYLSTLKSYIKRSFNAEKFDAATCSGLYITGKCLVDKSSEKVPQAAIDLYWSWLLDEEVAGKRPTISNRCGMRLSEMTAVLGTSANSKLTAWWLGFSHLQSGKPRILVPLSANPYVKMRGSVSNGILARKDKRGRWRFEVVEKEVLPPPKTTAEMPRIGIDVGLNVMAATSDGLLLGMDLKPKFNTSYAKIKTIRANRQRQGLKFYENSSRLDCLETKLTGLIKTMAGNCANKLVAKYPGHVFVIENLDLRGCRGQKRSAYMALHHVLVPRAATISVNCAYTSQPCRSCGYVSRRNRIGVKFQCRSCGKKGHADVFGGANVLGRSEDKQIGLDDEPSEVKAILMARYLARRNDSRDSSSGEPLTTALEPPSRKLTTGGSRK